MARQMQLLAIAAGGAIGTLARLALDEFTPATAGLPWATLSVNVVGSFVLGAVASATLAEGRDSSWRMPLLGTGFCGALTTFSGLCWETLELADRGHPGTAIAYSTLSVVLGIAAAVGGVRAMTRPRPPEGGRA